MPDPRIAIAIVSPRPNEFGEWLVRAYDSAGHRLYACDYFTTDKADAIATAGLMTGNPFDV